MLDTSLFNPILLQSPLHQKECLEIVDEIIEGLDERGINELMQGSNGDLDFILSNLVNDTFKTIYTNDHSVDFSLKYQQRLAESVEEIMRNSSLNYFITSVMPDFQMSWHHLEWGDLVMRHKKLCIEAARDHGKCLGINTLIRMSDGSLKLAKEIKVGDKVMGIDSKSRTVTAVNFGEDDNMYEIKQSKGDSYSVNSKHIMTVIKLGKKGKCLEQHEKHIVDIDLPELLNKSNNYIAENIRGFKVGFELPKKKVLIEPYFLGIWLGDGNNDKQLITKPDEEISDYCDEYAKRLGMDCYHDENKGNHNIKRKVGDSGRNNKLKTFLKNYDLLYNKHIPEQYLNNSRENRLQLLAGLLDTDGDLWCNGYHYGSIYKQLALDVKNLADGLGFRTFFGGGIKYNNQLKRDYEYWSVNISGKIDEIPLKIPRKKIQYDWNTKRSNKDWGVIDKIAPTVVSSLKIKNIGKGEFVSITTDGDKRFLLADGTVVHNSFYFSNAYAAWQLYKYSKPKKEVFSSRPSIANSNRGYLFSFSLQQAVDLIEILKSEIEGNDILRDRLFPDSRTTGAWASTNILCKNGARLTGKGFGSSVRGAHPYWIVVDDGLKDNVIYSQLQREKSTNYFHSVIMNMLVPGGQIIVVGTPFHSLDLYGDLKNKRGWFVIEYPSIFPDGRVLWPQRWCFKDLMEKRETQGNMIFSRENLCRPIVNEASIFPMSTLMRSIQGMDKYTLVKNRDDFPIKFTKVIVGCDFSISANVGADYTVFSVWGVDDNTQERWLLYMYREKGKTYFEQMQTLKSINIRFRPDLMVLEQNVFQSIYVQESDRQGLPVVGHHTGVDKYDLKDGWAGVALDMERGKVHIPTGDKYSEDMKDLIFQDLSSIAFTDKGLCSVSEHDDIGSSFWLAKIGVSKMTTGFKFSFL